MLQPSSSSFTIRALWLQANQVYTPTMNLSKSTSPFVSLPAELRNHIYAYTLSGEVIDIYCWRRYTPFGFATRVLRKQKNFLALLAVCRQLYIETRLLPFQLNAFRFKSQDAFQSWLDKFDSDQQRSIQEIHIVTWMSRHMVEGESWLLKPLTAVVPVDRISGLMRVEVEVRSNGTTKECPKEGCYGCEHHGEEANLEQERFEKWLVSCIEGVQVKFKMVMA